MTAVTSAPQGFTGLFVGPEHADYEEDRLAFFRQFDRRPTAIARCESAEDIALAVRHAREHDLEIAVRAGGHSLAGYSTTEGGLLVDLSRLKGIKFDVDNARARVQPGVISAEFVPAALVHGLAPVGGFHPLPGFVGLAIHGGRGLLSRKYGWSSDHIRSATLVTGDGSTITVSEDENSDLLYGLRGAGSNFGIVAELEVDLVPIPEKVLAGNLMYDHTAMESVMRGVLEGMEDGFSDALGAMLAVFKGPDGNPLLDVTLVHFGDQDIAEADINRIRELAEPIHGEVVPKSYAEHIAGAEELPFDRWEWEANRAELGPAELAAAVTAEAEQFPIGSDPEVPSYFIGIEPSGPGSSRPTDLPTAVPRNAHTAVFTFTVWGSAAEDSDLIPWPHKTGERLRTEGVCSDTTILNYNTVTGPETVMRAYGEDAYRRLQELKAKYDPENVFRLNHNVEPA